MAEEMDLIGGRMRERREELGLKQREVAERIPGKTESKDVSRWENGRHRPNPDTLDLIAKALETTVADLYAGPESARESKEAADLMESLNEAQEAAEVPKAVADALGALHAQIGEKLDQLHGEIEETKRLLESSGRTAKRSGS